MLAPSGRRVLRPRPARRLRSVRARRLAWLAVWAARRGLELDRPALVRCLLPAGRGRWNAAPEVPARLAGLSPAAVSEIALWESGASPENQSPFD